MRAIFYAAKRHELDQRRTSLMLRDEEAGGAHPTARSIWTAAPQYQKHVSGT